MSIIISYNLTVFTVFLSNKCSLSEHKWLGVKNITISYRHQTFVRYICWWALFGVILLLPEGSWSRTHMFDLSDGLWTFCPNHCIYDCHNTENTLFLFPVNLSTRCQLLKGFLKQKFLLLFGKSDPAGYQASEMSVINMLWCIVWGSDKVWEVLAICALPREVWYMMWHAFHMSQCSI